MANESVQIKFPRLYEIHTLSDQQNPDNCLYGFSELPLDSDGNSFYGYYEKLFQRIDQDNWEVFKEKLSEKVLGIRPVARISIMGKSDKEKHSLIYQKFQGFDFFNEVHGYIYLKEKKCYEKVTFLQESNTKHKKTPDLKGIKGSYSIVLDVKTINSSDDLHTYFEHGVRDDHEASIKQSLNLDYPRAKKEILRGL